MKETKYITKQELNKTLKPHQLKAKEFVVKNKRCGLYLDMGVGKTLSTLASLYDIQPKYHILVIAPINIARYVWIDEIKKWKMNIRYKSLILNENNKKLSKKQRYELYDEVKNMKPTMFFINLELVSDLVDYFKGSFPFKFLIIDESQSFKNPRAKRFKALKKIVNEVDRVVELSGTPTPRSIEDLWSQIFLLDKGQRLGKTLTSFRTKYLRPTNVINGIPINYVPLPHAEKEIYDKISDIAISLKNVNLSLPPLIINDIHLSLSDKEKKLYKTLAKTEVLKIVDEPIFEGVKKDEQDITVIAKSAGALHAKLCQMASGALYINENKDYIKIHEQKLDMCKDIINRTGSNVMIAYFFKTDRYMLEEYFKKHKIAYKVFDGSAEIKDDWNNGKIPVMLVQPKSMGHGMNLQTGGNVLIWYSMIFDLELYLQTNKRLHRPGQTKSVIIHRLIVDDTIDTKASKALEKKKVTQDDLLDALDATLKSL